MDPSLTYIRAHPDPKETTPSTARKKEEKKNTLTLPNQFPQLRLPLHPPRNQPLDLPPRLRILYPEGGDQPYPS